MDKKKLTFEAIAIKDDVGYASDYNRNSLFKVDMKTGECTFIRLFDDEPVNLRRLHCTAVWIDKKIYFIPGSGNKIAVFYPEDNSIESIQIPLPKSKQFSFYKSQFKFIRAVKYKENLWLIPCSYPGILKLNMQTKKIQVLDKWLENDTYFFRAGLYVNDNKIVIANGKSNAVLNFDMEKESGNIIHIGSENNGVMSICKEGDVYWFAPRLPGSIVAWNPLTDTVTEFDEYPQEFESGKIVFSYVYSLKNKIFFLPAKANKTIVFNNGNLEIEKNILWKENNQSTLEYLFETEEERYFRETGIDENDRYIKIGKRDNVLSEYDFYFLDDGKRDSLMIESMASNNEIVIENKYIGLNEFIRGLM